mgnify:CR=1 FL=1
MLSDGTAVFPCFTLENDDLILSDDRRGTRARFRRDARAGSSAERRADNRADRRVAGAICRPWKPSAARVCPPREALGPTAVCLRRREAPRPGDLVQEAALRVLGNPDTFEPRHVGAMQAYRGQSVINRICDEVRAHLPASHRRLELP